MSESSVAPAPRESAITSRLFPKPYDQRRPDDEWWREWLTKERGRYARADTPEKKRRALKSVAQARRALTRHLYKLRAQRGDVVARRREQWIREVEGFRDRMNCACWQITSWQGAAVSLAEKIARGAREDGRLYTPAVLARLNGRLRELEHRLAEALPEVERFFSSAPAPYHVWRRQHAGVNGAHTVTYRVSGTARAVSSISYRGEAHRNGNSWTANDVRCLPWTQTFDAVVGRELMIIAKNGTAEGQVTAEILIDGRQLQSATSEGPYAAASIWAAEVPSEAPPAPRKGTASAPGVEAPLPANVVRLGEQRRRKVAGKAEITIGDA